MKYRKEQLYQLWNFQLYKEHEFICWNHKVTLSKPAIEIVTARSFWGSYEQINGFGLIRIGAHLIENHCWDVVINVLKHEMAHQLVAEYFSGNGCHDKTFDRACDMLGVPDMFRKASGDIPKIMKNHDVSEQQKNIFEKVQKLLALAQSPLIHEAQMAMQKANQLILKYNLERIEQNDVTDYTYKIINHRKKRIENYQRHICSILINHFFVKVIYGYLYDASKNDVHRTIELLGTPENIAIAEHVYYFLLNRLDRLWTDYRKENQTCAKDKRSFFFGLLKGFASKLEQNQAPESSPVPVNAAKNVSKTLIAVEDKHLDVFIANRHPRLYRTKSRLNYVNAKAYADGISTGKQIVLYKGVAKQDGFKGKQIDYNDR